MKNLLIGLLALGSISAFANCDLSIVGNMNNKRLDFIKETVRENGYQVIYSGKSDYTLAISGNSEMFQEGECVVVDAQLKEEATGRIIHKEHNDACGIFAGNNWNKRIKKVLKDLPECK